MPTSVILAGISVCAKRIPPPPDSRLARITIVDRKDIESQRTCGPRPITHEQMLRREDDPALFVSVHAIDGRDLRAAFSRSHFHDDQHRRVSTYEIELAETAAIALLENLEAERCKIVACDRFPGLAVPMALRCGNADSLSRGRDFADFVAGSDTQHRRTAVAKLRQRQAAMHSATFIETQLA